MSSDDQHFLDVLSALPSSIHAHSLQLASSLDAAVDSAASSLRSTLSSTPWLPSSLRPSPPRVRGHLGDTAAATAAAAAAAGGQHGYLERAYAWVDRHRTVTAAVVVLVGAAGWVVWRRRRRYARKRRARRASNGARREVVVLAAPPNEPICKSLALDLERRGFIVYVVVGSPEEEQMVLGESRVDIRPLRVDMTNPGGTQAAIDRFVRTLLSPQQAFLGATPHNLNLAGFILMPDSTYPTGPIETLSPEIWADCLNVRVLGGVATTQAFLRSVCEFKARVLVLTRGIVPSLALPFHAVESAVSAALEAFTRSLRAELAPLAVDVCHFKLGLLDTGAVGGRHHLQTVNAARADVLSWSPSARATYAKNYFAQSTAAMSAGFGAGGQRSAPPGGPKGSPLRELHNAVFDALTSPRPKEVWHVGRGSLVYDMVGRWAPAGLVGWMLGARTASRDEASSARLDESDGVEWESVERSS